MKFEDLLKAHNVSADDVVKKVQARAEQEDYGRLSDRIWEEAESPRDFLRAYEPIVRISKNGHIEIRLLTDGHVVDSKAHMSHLTVNGVPVDVEQLRTERAVRSPPGSRSSMGIFLYLSGTSAELATRTLDPSSLVVKGQIEGGPELVALAGKE